MRVNNETGGGIQNKNTERLTDEILPVANNRTECRLGSQLIVQKASIWCPIHTTIVQDQRTEVGQKLTSCPVAILYIKTHALISIIKLTD